jgi:hypothetical protein
LLVAEARTIHTERCCTGARLKIAEVSGLVHPCVQNVIAHQVAEGTVANQAGGIQVLDVCDAYQGRDPMASGLDRKRAAKAG